MAPPQGAYDEFVARFPYDETEDQTASIDTVLDDLASGKPMDRLVCGDVGFGKTEVALRAAFVAALDGFQVAVVVPTTLLARQHFATFTAALQGPARAHRPGLAPGRRPRSSPPSRPASRTAPSTSSSARTRCSARRIAFKRLGPADRRRGAALRRRPQGAPEAAARGRARADADRHADPAHAAAGAVRRARAVADHHAAGRPPGRAHLHLAVRSRHHPRGAAARALPRRPELLRRAAHRRPRRGRRVPGRGRRRS